MLGLIAVLAGAVAPSFAGGADRARARSAARFLAARCAFARTEAIRRGATVALRFDGGTGHTMAPYVDGNDNGVRAADIAAGVDTPIERAIRLADLFPGVRLSLALDVDADLPGEPVLLSFAPEGSASSGSAYVHAADGTTFVVRTFGITGRTRVLRYDAVRQVFVEVL